MNDDESIETLLTHSIEGNAVGVQDVVNSILAQKALDALSSMKVDVAQSIYGTYGSEDQDADIDPELESDAEEDIEIEDLETDDLLDDLEDAADEEDSSNEEETPDE